MVKDSKIQLVEIKKGQTGTGLLLENDGYMSLDMPENKILKESIDEFNNGMANDLPRPFVVSAVFQKYGIENANGRVYPEAILKREVERFQDKIAHRMALCELEHPSDSNINLERICAVVTEVHWVGRTLVGKLEIPISEGFRRYGVCSTLADRVGQWLVSGVRVGISSRALGNVKQEMGRLVVDDSLELITFDLVSTPSTHNAWLEDNEENLQPYIESVTKDDTKIIKESKNDKYSEIEKWLNG